MKLKIFYLLTFSIGFILTSSTSYAQVVMAESGLPEGAHLYDDWDVEPPEPSSKPYRGCYRMTCQVWADIDKTTQTMHLYVAGQLAASWPVSTGRRQESPNMDTHPNGRIYEAYESKEHPGGGDYMDLGNMPYTVFVRGGIAIHGTPRRNWRKLGRPASHGCIRLHPDNAYIFMNLVKMVGIRHTWITIRGVTPR